MSDVGSTAEEPMVCTTLRWREMDSNFRSPVKKSQFLEMVCADFFRHFPSERDPIRLPLPVEMSQQGTPELQAISKATRPFRSPFRGQPAI